VWRYEAEQSSEGHASSTGVSASRGTATRDPHPKSDPAKAGYLTSSLCQREMGPSTDIKAVPPDLSPCSVGAGAAAERIGYWSLFPMREGQSQPMTGPGGGIIHHEESLGALRRTSLRMSQNPSSVAVAAHW
jgi:hypothetical protein